MSPPSTETDFFGPGKSLTEGLHTVAVEVEPETYSEYYDLVTERLFKTSGEEGIGFLERYVEKRGSFFGFGSIGTSLRKHSYLKEDIGKSHPNERDRIEEALVDLRDTRREKGELTLDDIVATSYLLPDEFDRQATFLLAYELGYLEPSALGVSVPIKRKTGTTQRSPTKTEGQEYIAELLQWMDKAASKRMLLRELLPKIHFFLHDGPRLYTAALEDIKEKRYDVAEVKLNGILSVAANSRLVHIEGPIAYQLALIALNIKDDAKAEEFLIRTVMLPSNAFPVRYGVQQEGVYRELIALYQKQKKTPEALWALAHLQQYYPKSVILGIHKEYIEEHAFAEGKTAFADGNLEAAVSCFVLETTVKPKNAWGWYYLGMTEHKRRKADPAQAAYTQAIQLHPTFATKDFNEATTLLGNKQYTKALWAIEHACEVAHYSDKTPRQKIAALANKIGAVFKDGKDVPKDYTAATRAFTAALASDATNADAHYHIGTIAFMRKNYTAAVQEFSQSIATRPKHAWAFYQLGRTYDALKKTAEAQTAYSFAVNLGHAEAKKLLKK